MVPTVSDVEASEGRKKTQKQNFAKGTDAIFECQLHYGVS